MLLRCLPLGVGSSGYGKKATRISGGCTGPPLAGVSLPFGVASTPLTASSVSVSSSMSESSSDMSRNTALPVYRSSCTVVPSGSKGSRYQGTPPLAKTSVGSSSTCA
ncbi:hypothetical protein KC325_g196 [Hortaea werneckii]|nr:hypothetical protein KC325_g196 [Hortaea werneckii]